MNSKGEFNRCFIPRLMVMEEDKLKELEEMDKKESKNIESWIQGNQEAWESTRIRKRADDMRKDLDKTGRLGQKSKTPRDSQTQKPSLRRAKKRRMYQLMEDDWGEAKRMEDDPKEDQEHQESDKHEEQGDSVLELCSSNHPDPPTLQAGQEPLSSFEERQTAGDGQENTLLHPLVTSSGHQDAHAGHESTAVMKTGIEDHLLLEDSPFVDKDSGDLMKMNTSKHAEKLSNTSQEPLHRPPQHHQRPVVEQEHREQHQTLLPSVESVNNLGRVRGYNCMKTTFQWEQTPSTPPDSQEHLVGVKNIQEHRDVVRDGSGGYQNLENFENSRLPPPPHW